MLWVSQRQVVEHKVHIQEVEEERRTVGISRRSKIPRTMDRVTCVGWVWVRFKQPGLQQGWVQYKEEEVTLLDPDSKLSMVGLFFSDSKEKNYLRMLSVGCQRNF